MGSPKSVYLPISKLHSILTVANLLAHNNISQICYCGQISLQSAAVNCSFSDNLTSLGVSFILLAIVHIIETYQKNSFPKFFIVISYMPGKNSSLASELNDISCYCIPVCTISYYKLNHIILFSCYFKNFHIHSTFFKLFHTFFILFHTFFILFHTFFIQFHTIN